MKKVALLISGYLRSFEYNYEQLKRKILDKYDTDIYLHISLDEKSNDRYSNNKINIDNIINTLKPITMLCESDNNSKLNGMMQMWNKIYKLNNIKKNKEILNGYKYDCVIKYRPDMCINNINFNIDSIIENTIYIPIDSKIDKKKLKYIKDPYICDIFAYGDSNIMNKYCNIYESLEYLTEKYKTNISETLLYYYLHDSNINYKLIDIDYDMILSMCNIIGIAGDSGVGKTTLGNILKPLFNNSFLLEGDRYHKWERGDENWKKYTHLNPNANFLAKMKEDVFNLKIGNNIYQVDYDHSNGKFTDKEEIKSKDNILLCGLHSLYCDQTSKYINIKIFVDTQEKLKIYWKCRRDMKKRGHKLDKIMNQIKMRKTDYDNFIMPQKNKSDIIIQYYTDDILDNNIDIDVNIKLKILIKNNDMKLVKIFKKYIKNFEYTFDEKYNILNFKDEEFDIQCIYNEISKNKNYDNNFQIQTGYNGIIQCILLFII